MIDIPAVSCIAQGRVAHLPRTIKVRVTNALAMLDAPASQLPFA